VTVFTKNRERLLDGDIAEAFFQALLQQARERSLLSDEHFAVDGTLLEAGGVCRVISANMVRTPFHGTILAIRQWTSTGRSGRTKRTHRRRTRMRRWHAKARAKRRN